MTARPSVFFRTPLTCIPAAILRRTDGADAVVPAALRRDNARRGAIYDARCRNGTTRPRHCVGRCTRRCGGRRATMHVGAPFMTPGAGNGTTRSWHCVGRCTRWCRKIAILRRSSGRHKCRPYVAGCSSAESRRSDGAGAVVPAALRRDNARRGAIYDARCRNGTTRPWHCVGRCTRWCRKIAILRRSSGRHKCRSYGTGCSSATLRQAVAVNGRRFRRRGRSLQTHDSSRNDRCRPALRVSRPAH